MLSGHITSTAKCVLKILKNTLWSANQLTSVPLNRVIVPLSKGILSSFQVDDYFPASPQMFTGWSFAKNVSLNKLHTKNKVEMIKSMRGKWLHGMVGQKHLNKYFMLNKYKCVIQKCDTSILD